MHPTKKIGLIAGDGDIPLKLLMAWAQRGFDPYVINLTGRKDLGDFPSSFFSMGQVAHIVEFFRHSSVTDLVIVGRVVRPNFMTLRADIKGVGLIGKLLMNKMTRGDDGLLKFVRRALENEGFTVHAVQEFLPDLLCPEGVLTQKVPTQDDMSAILHGVQHAKHHGLEDKGQAVVVMNGAVTAYEGRGGTNALIASSPSGGRKILIKVSKPQQDMALDVPTIGLETIRRLERHGFVGLAIEAGRTLVIDREQVVAACNKAGLFFMGISGEVSPHD